MAKHVVFYLTYRPTVRYPASSVNTQNRIRMWQRLGYAVVPYFTSSVTPKSWWTLLRTVKRDTRLIIRIDGSGNLDAYTLIKIFVPATQIYWEIHGSIEEREWGTTSSLGTALKSVWRFLLSWLTSGYMFISPTLQTYTAKRIATKKHIVLPNFFVPSRGVFKRNTLVSMEKRRPSFVVFWGGDPKYRWQAVDLVDQVAEGMRATDPDILFVVIGEGSWYRLKSQSNIMVLPLLDEQTYQAVVDKSHVCLALYHTEESIPFYFSPLKIITYLAYGKPVIATQGEEISRLISDEINGFLTSNSVTQIVKYIQMLRSQTDLYKRMSRAAKQSGERFTVESMSVAWKSRLKLLFS